MTNKMRRRIVRIIWYNEMGRMKVIGRISSVTAVISVFTFLKVYGISITPLIMAICGIMWYLGAIILGWVYVKLGLLKDEYLYYGQNDPYLSALYEDMKEKNAKK